MNNRFFSILFVLSILSTNNSNATIWNVGTSHTYLTPNELYLADATSAIDMEDSDTIYIETGEYVGTDALAAWSQNNLYIAGIGTQPHMKADGAYILGKGTWVCIGDNITVENIEFSEASVPDQNGAGIRLDGTGLTLINCFFHHNENGILTSNPNDGDILIEYCEFAYNGYGDGYTHNMYIGHVNSFTIRYSYSHHANIGHNIKSRATKNYILYNRIMDEDTGNSSRLIDLPNGGYSVIEGNILMQGPSAENNNAVGYGLEGLSNPEPHAFFYVYNTVVNKRTASCLFLSVKEGTDEVYIVNNAFAGTGTVLSGDATTMTHNYAHTDISHFDFMDEASFNYAIKSTSPLRDTALTLSTDLIPVSHYVHPLTQENRLLHGSRMDIGAYEFISLAGLQEQIMDVGIIYPNPTKGILSLELTSELKKESEIFIYDISGNLVFTTNIQGYKKTIDLSHLQKGTYILSIIMEEKTVQKHVIIQ